MTDGLIEIFPNKSCFISAQAWGFGDKVLFGEHKPIKMRLHLRWVQGFLLDLFLDMNRHRLPSLHRVSWLDTQRVRKILVGIGLTEHSYNAIERSNYNSASDIRSKEEDF